MSTVVGGTSKSYGNQDPWIFSMSSRLRFPALGRAGTGAGRHSDNFLILLFVELILLKYQLMKKMNRPDNRDFRKNLRRSMTPAETQLWKSLRGRRCEGKKFRRQHGIAEFVVDFYCPDAKLIIELDGETHNSPQNREYDEQRQVKLQEMGFTILRFDNSQIFEDLPHVMACIAQKISEAEVG